MPKLITTDYMTENEAPVEHNRARFVLDERGLDFIELVVNRDGVFELRASGALFLKPVATNSVEVTVERRWKPDQTKGSSDV